MFKFCPTLSDASFCLFSYDFDFFPLRVFAKITKFIAKIQFICNNGLVHFTLHKPSNKIDYGVEIWWSGWSKALPPQTIRRSTTGVQSSVKCGRGGGGTPMMEDDLFPLLFSEFGRRVEASFSADCKMYC